MSGCGHTHEPLAPTNAKIDGLMRALMVEPRVMGEGIDPHVGGKFIAYAIRGAAMREHVDACHPGEVERVAEMAAPKDEDGREAWLYGYRFGEGVVQVDAVRAATASDWDEFAKPLAKLVALTTPPEEESE